MWGGNGESSIGASALTRQFLLFLVALAVWVTPLAILRVVFSAGDISVSAVGLVVGVLIAYALRPAFVETRQTDRNE
ncbi:MULTISPECIES: hypothetical protein [unclassified Haladaptatus]|uniref:hypothetical protein n=1 Tax=unclassified Haladaptatus TaxID=2622732 RepID=UPI0023E81A4D|nr:MULTISPECIES: hypothetical protein [unclassified Haladaptatus]